MAKAHVFRISDATARGYNVPANRPIVPNGAGVTAIMGLTNGRGAASRHRCRDDEGKFVTCDYVPNTREDDIADRIRDQHPRWGVKRRVREIQKQMRGRKRRAPAKSKRGGATCWKKPRAKYQKLGATKRSDYAYPECWAYPVKGRGVWSKRLTAQAARWFKVHGHKYSPSVRTKIASRIGRAARQLGLDVGTLTSGRSGKRARRNEGASPMIVMQGPESDFESNRRRGKRRGKKSAHRRGRKGRWGSMRAVTLTPKGRGINVARRNGFGDDESSMDVMSYGEMMENARRRGRKSRSRKGAARRRSYGKARRWGKKSRKSSRRKSARRGGSFKGIHRVRATRAGKGLTVFLKNTTVTPAMPNLTHRDPLVQQYLAEVKSTRPGPMREKVKRKWQQRLRAAELQRRAVTGKYQKGMGGLGGMWGASPYRGFLPPWYQASFKARMQRKLERQKKKQARMALAMPALFQGLGPRDLKRAMKDLTKAQVEALFPDFQSFRAWMRSMQSDRKFRRWSGKARRYGRGRWAARRRFGRGRKRWGRGRRRFGRGRNRWGRGRRRGYGRKGRRGGRRYGRKGRWGRRFRRNGFMPNLPFVSAKEMIIAGLLGLGTFGILSVGSQTLSAKVNPLAGAAFGLLGGAAAAFLADKAPVSDASAKAISVAGIIALVGSAVGAIRSLMNKGVSGFGAIGGRSTQAHYLPMGAYYQAQAGFGAPFQQALAAPFQQAAAGFGEYYGQPLTGTGEYVSNDGALAPVSDFGEYVAGHLQVEGYGDYEVMPQYAPSADGMGYVSEGVNPADNMDRQFDIIEAAAGLGATAVPRSDHVPSVMTSGIRSTDSSENAGVFDIGGGNGVFG